MESSIATATRPADDDAARLHGPDVGNGMTPDARSRRLSEAAAERGVRGLLVIETELAESATEQDRGGEPDRGDRIAARLGTENPRLVHDARRRLDPALLAAEAGTVPAGGVLTLLVPPLGGDGVAPWPSRSGARFARLLLAHLETEPDVCTRIAWTGEASPALAPGDDSSDAPGDASRGSHRAAATPDAASLDAQDALLARALRRLREDPRPLLVIEAPRGHGKSALLGRIAARLADEGDAPILCAARRTALDVLERHRRLEADPDAPPLAFLAPDTALRRGGETLLVDEAASLPLPLLAGLLERWRRVVLASTSAGYEVAGRAFALRLPERLDRERPGWLRLTPPAPLRWRAGDPLDTLLTRAILSAAPLPAPSAHARSAASHVPAARVDRDVLIDDETRLAGLFGLLAATHYQSTPLDLEHLLDGPDVALWSIEHAGEVLGAALVAIEPGIPEALHDAVLARRRRLPHRLLPQLLAQAADDGGALGAPFARVLRIAVHPALRRRGLGRRLVRAIVRDTRDVVEAVGASFGETPATAAFWNADGFVAFHRGHRPNPRSGRRSLAVLRPGSGRTRRALAVAGAVHRDNAAAPAADSPPAGAPPDATLLARFARGERSFSDTRAALRRFAGPVGSDADGRGADDATALLGALGLEVPNAPRRREARLRAAVAARLAPAVDPDPPAPTRD